MASQTIVDIDVANLLTKVREFQARAERLVQVSCTRLPDKLELLYSFDKDFKFTCLRLFLANTDKPIPSISAIYGNAFLYENELHDLFGIKIEGISIDYKGKFYKTSIATPFNLPAGSEGAKP